jgi:transglutaminase-like putative cysteine protease
VSAPALLVGAALLAWGYAGANLALAAVLALAFEAARLAAPRDNPLAGREPLVVRVALLAAVALFVFAGATQRFPGAIYFALRWLPVALFPAVLLQALGARNGLDAAVLRAALRLPGEPRDARAVDLTHAFAAVALIGAAASDPAARWFYPAAAAIAAWALLARARRRAAAALMLAIAAPLGFAILTGLTTLQSSLEDWSAEFLEQLLSAGPDPFRERTRIGDMGRIKLSDRIAMRVVPAGERPAQILLREASFDTYVNGEWRARLRTFTPLTPGPDGWRLRAGEARHAIVIRRAFGRGEGLLALPAGTASIAAVAGASLSTLPMGTVRAQGLPSFLAQGVAFEPQADFAAAPSPADLEVPELLRPVLEQVLAQQRVPRDSPRAAEAAIRRFFDERFAYSLTLSDGRGGTRTLREFLLQDHKGHCEYFATASALLLRQAGVPARYTVGYSAQEYSALERAFVVRDRHSHAWTSAWLDGRWVDVDNTPSRWADFEERDARAWYGPALDLASWLVDAGRKLLAQSAWDLRTLGIGLLPLGLAGAAWLLLRRVRRPRAPTPAPEHPATAAWRRIEAHLAQRGLGPRPGETARAFAERLAPQLGGGEGLRALARDYYVARFDPASGPPQSERLAGDADRWLDDAAQASPRMRST